MEREHLKILLKMDISNKTLSMYAKDVFTKPLEKIQGAKHLSRKGFAVPQHINLPPRGGVK
jgi:hypothetical protein